MENLGKILKNQKITPKNSEKLKIWKNNKNLETYFKFEKILTKFWWKIRKNTQNSEKHSGKLGKILPKTRIPESKSLFPTMHQTNTQTEVLE